MGIYIYLRREYISRVALLGSSCPLLYILEACIYISTASIWFCESQKQTEERKTAAEPWKRLTRHALSVDKNVIGMKQKCTSIIYSFLRLVPLYSSYSSFFSNRWTSFVYAEIKMLRRPTNLHEFATQIEMLFLGLVELRFVIWDHFGSIIVEEFWRIVEK